MKLEMKIIDYKDYENEIKHWVKLKGEFRYIKIITFLQKNKIDLTWTNVTDYIKYDKRILINSFKYIVFLEEFFRSAVYEVFKNNKVNNMAFISIMDEFLKNENLSYDNMNLYLLKEKKQAINCFRNSIVHNKVLLDKKFEGNTLEELLDIFKQILPKSYRKGFINDINLCSKNLKVKDYWYITLKEE